VPAPPADDGELVRALKAKKSQAASTFYARTRPVASRTILRLLRSTEDHEELVQLVMIELVLGIERFRGQCTLDAWVSVVTAHLVFKYLRSRKRDRLVFSALGEDGSPAYTVPTASSGKLAVTRELLTRLTAVLQSMDSAKAEVFVLHEVHGFDLKEVAEI